jgi:hypothetical protein
MRCLPTHRQNDTLRPGRRATGETEVLKKFGVLQLLAGKSFYLNLLNN